MIACMLLAIRRISDTEDIISFFIIDKLFNRTQLKISEDD